jgi:small redox-active disulfide protein 2
MKIEILGSGCKNCNALESATQRALQQLGIDEAITKVTDYGQIASYGVMSTPALAIDGEVKTTGRVPSVDEIADLITATV